MKTKTLLVVSLVAVVATICCVCGVLALYTAFGGESNSGGGQVIVHIRNDSLSTRDVHHVLETAADANTTDEGTKHVAVELHWKLESGMLHSTIRNMMSSFSGAANVSMNNATDFTDDYTFNVHLDFSNVSMNVISENVDDETKEVIDAITDLERNDISELVILKDAPLVGCDKVKYMVCDKSPVPCRFYNGSITNFSKARALASDEDEDEDTDGPTALEDSVADSPMGEATILENSGAKNRTNETIRGDSSFLGRRTWIWQHRRRRFDINLGRVSGWVACYGGAAVHTSFHPPAAVLYGTPAGMAAMTLCNDAVRQGVNKIDGNGGRRRRSWFDWFR